MYIAVNPIGTKTATRLWNKPLKMFGIGSRTELVFLAFLPTRFQYSLLSIFSHFNVIRAWICPNGHSNSKLRLLNQNILPCSPSKFIYKIWNIGISNILKQNKSLWISQFATSKNKLHQRCVIIRWNDFNSWIWIIINKLKPRSKYILLSVQY